MLDRVIFYNHFGAGDIFESREFVKEWMQIVEAKEYFYAHGKNPKILKDIPELQFTQITDKMNGMSPMLLDDNTFYVNTWIGRNSSYVLPGIGCVVEELYRMHNDMLIMAGFRTLSKKIIQYIPNIDYLCYNISGIDEFLGKNVEKDKILLCNGPVQSNQAQNFDFTPVILKVADAYKDKLIFITSPIQDKPDNVIFTGDIIDGEGFDLNEISYLSRYCRLLIGRNSGPHVFAQVYDNWMDENKKLISYTYRPEGGSFVSSQPVKLKKYWSPSTDAETIFIELEGVMDV